MILHTRSIQRATSGLVSKGVLLLLGLGVGASVAGASITAESARAGAKWGSDSPPAKTDEIVGPKSDDVAAQKSDEAQDVADGLVDATVDGYRAELLELAFRAAGAVPIKPHVKNRTRMQESVVDACLELGLARRALRYAESIEGWRRGTAYADLAMHLAQHGHTSAVPRFLDLARDVSEKTEAEGAQDWAKDRIRVKIAGVHAWLGNTEKAIEFATGAVAAEAGKVNAVTAMKIGDGDCDAQMQLLDKQIALGALDTTRNALGAYVQLFNTFYGDKERREAIEGKIQSSWGKTPVQIRYDIMMQLVGSALAHEDSKKALALCKETQELLDSVKWLPEDKIALTARLSAGRHRAGDAKQARADLDATVVLYDKERLNIANVDRGGALRPVAEAYQAMGDAKTALAIYRCATEEGVVNANSRPRADDLVATCCSMARVGVEPDKELRARLEDIRSKLGDPW